MTREQMIDKLRHLSEDEFGRIAPFLEADLEVLEELAPLLDEIDKGRESARTEPSLAHDEALSYAREQLRQSRSE